MAKTVVLVGIKEIKKEASILRSLLVQLEGLEPSQDHPPQRCALPSEL